MPASAAPLPNIGVEPLETHPVPLGPQMKVFTIGYEGLDIDLFITTLVKNGIGTLVDVRQLPLSRKRGFSKKALAGALAGHELGYLHIPALGCPKPVRDRYRQDGSWQRYTQGFLQHLSSQEGAVAQLAGLVASSNCALLCFEADPNFCHRSMVADAVQAQCGAEVRHLRPVRAEKVTVETRRRFAVKAGESG